MFKSMRGFYLRLRRRETIWKALGSWAPWVKDTREVFQAHTGTHIPKVGERKLPQEVLWEWTRGVSEEGSLMGLQWEWAFHRESETWLHGSHGISKKNQTLLGWFLGLLPKPWLPLTPSLLRSRNCRQFNTAWRSTDALMGFLLGSAGWPMDHAVAIPMLLRSVSAHTRALL